MKTGKIYIHRNKKDGKVYVGSTVQDVRRRWRRDHKDFVAYKTCTIFYRALCKYGWDMFESTVVEDNIPASELKQREEYYIKLYDSVKNGYNTIKIDNGLLEYTLEAKLKISKANRENNGMRGKKAVNRNDHFEVNGVMSKHCNKCDTTKPLTEFNKYKTTWDKLHYHCRECCKQIGAAQRKRTKKVMTEEEKRLYYKFRDTSPVTIYCFNIKTKRSNLYKSYAEVRKAGFRPNSIKKYLDTNIQYKNCLWFKKRPITTIFARKCEIREVDTSLERNFLNQNHKQGYFASKVCYGLFYKNELVCLMSFGKSRFEKKYQWEVYRLCSPHNTYIPGGASKLFKHFIKLNNPKNVITYATLGFSKEGDVYTKIGFSYLKTSKKSYYYEKNGQTLSRYKAQKHKLIKILGNEYDSRLTEYANMTRAGYIKIYVPGSKSYGWKSD